MNNPERYTASDSVSANFYKKAELISSLIPNSGTLLDLGCWDGSLAHLFLKDFDGYSIGTDYTPQPKANATHNMVISCELEQTILPLQDNTVDCVFLGEVIEHIYDTDFLITEINRVMKKKGSLVLTTPNLSSLLNRILLLFGFQPMETEISTISCKFGNKFNPDKIPSGHIRNFTFSALQDFLNFYSLKIFNHYSVPASRRNPAKIFEQVAGFISPKLGGDTIIKAIKLS